MTLGLALKNLLSLLLDKTGFAQKTLLDLGRNGQVILTYHRVLNHEEAVHCSQPGLFTLTATFEAHLKCLKEVFSVISLQDFHFGRLHPAPPKPVCVLTFDDGWKDFYTNAYPLLKFYGLPATVFLPTGYIGTGHQFWTERLAYFLGHVSGDKFKISMQSPAGRILALKGPQSTKVEKAISFLKKSNNKVIEDTLSEMAKVCEVKETLQEERHFLNWEEVREMKNSGLIAFGSHTVSHEILTNLAQEEVSDELVKSKEKLLAESAVDSDFVPFCYPNGDFTSAIVSKVRKAGYSAALTTKRGWNIGAGDPFELSRVSIHQDISSTMTLFRCRVAGIF